MAAPGAGGISIDQLEEGVRQKYGQKMIQRKPGEEYARSMIGQEELHALEVEKMIKN